jgi:glucosamine-6-phosphate deaminase
MQEIRDLMNLTPDEVVDRAGEKLVVCDDLDALHQRFAEDIASEIRQQNELEMPTRLILPVGPTGQYPYLIKFIERDSVDLSNCWFFFMDEYCDAEGTALPPTHALSFQGIARREFLDNLDPSRGLIPDRVLFPSELNINELGQIIRNAGGIDTCYGGIGIHGHVAFNEPSTGISRLGPRRVKLNYFTVTINAIRAQVGGNLECFPREAYTLGISQVLGARRIRLYCRNGTPYDWANTVLRLALFGTPGDDYPVTYIRNKDYVITTDKDTLASPQNLI